MAENIIGPRKLGGGPSRDPNDKSGGSSKKGSGKSLNDALKSTADQNKGKDKGKGGKNKKPESGSVADQGKDKGKDDKNKKPESGLAADQNKDKDKKDKKDKDEKDSSKSDKDKDDKKSPGNNDQDNDDDQDDNDDGDDNGDESIANKIIRRQPDDDDKKRQRRRREAMQAAKMAPKAAIEYGKLKALSDFYEHVIYPIIKFFKAAWAWIKNAFAWIGQKLAGFWRMLANFFQNLPRYIAMAGRKLGQLFGTAKAKLVSGITNTLKGLGLMANAALVSTVSNAIIAASIMAFFTGLIGIIGLIFTFMNPINQLKKTLNNADCQVKVSNSDEDNTGLDDATSSGKDSSSGRITMATLKKKGIKTTFYKNDWHKNALQIDKACHKLIPKIPAGYFYAQIYQETGGVMTGPAKYDRNFAGISGNAVIKDYDTDGSGQGRGIGEGGAYQHFKSLNGFIAMYATTLKSDFANVKKISSLSQYNTVIKKHGYYASDDVAGYLAGLQTGYNFYKHGGPKKNLYTGVEKVKEGASKLGSGIQSFFDNFIGGGSSQNCEQVMDDKNIDTGSILKEAKKFKGWFKYGQSGRSSNWKHPTKTQTVDCSGFVWIIVRRVTKKNFSMWYTKSAEQMAEEKHPKIIKKINRSEAKPGDIIIVNTGSGGGDDGHMAILETKWNGETDKTRVIQMGGYSNNEGVNEHGFRESFFRLLNRADTKITIARVLGVKTVSSGDDRMSSNYGKGQAVVRKLSKAENNARLWIIKKESDGNPKAENSSTHAYGYYQLLPAHFKKGTYHSDGTRSKANQHVVGYYYMKDRYGSWQNAKKFWIKHNWW